MSEGAPGKSTKLQAALGDAFQAGWRRRTAEDQHEPALEQLAAFAEGRLTPREEAEVAREIAASPAALEILAGLVDDSRLWQRLPADGAESAAEAAPTTLRMPAPSARQRERRRTQVAAWAVAASLAVAAWGVVSNRSMRVQLAEATKNEGAVERERERADRAASELLLARKTRVAELAQPERAPYIVGQSSPEWAALADSTVAEGLARGGLRGGADLSEEDAEAISRAKDDLFATAQEHGLLGLPGRLEYAAALVTAGRLEDAENVLEETQEVAAEAPGTLAQWQNLRATLLATRAADAPMTEAEPLLAEAETLFRQSAEGGLNCAWLNLSMLLLEQGDAGAAEEALQTYRAGAGDAAGE